MAKQPCRQHVSQCNIVAARQLESGGGYTTWLIKTQTTNMNGNDYCFSQSMLSKFQLATDCPNFTVVSGPLNYNYPGQPFSESFYYSAKRMLPMMIVSNASSGSVKKIGISWSLPLSSPPQCKGEQYQWSDNLEVEIRKTNGTANYGPFNKYKRGAFASPPSNPFSGFEITRYNNQTALLTSGTYFIRYRGVINSDGAMSEYIYAPIFTLP